jgi:hypothetical protein
MIALWMNGTVILYIYCLFLRKNETLTREDFNRDVVIKGCFHTILVGKYGAFTLGIYIIGAILGAYTL